LQSPSAYDAAVVLRSLDVESVGAYSGGDGYEWWSGTARFGVDPDLAGNDRIVDLALAPRDPDGTVAFDADVRVLRPTNGGNRKLLLVVPNRGLAMGMPFSVGVDPAQLIAAVPPPGDGFLLDRGWTVAWCGWQWDVKPGPAMLGLRAPYAEVGPGWMRVEWRSDELLADHPLSDSGPLFAFTDYPTADVDDADAVLTVRTSPDGPRTVIERSQWSFPDATHVALEGGFQPFYWYELVYRTDRAPVAGAGLLAIRDLGAYLRRDVDHAFAFGVSQSGRVLRQLLKEGLNLDEFGQQVFDGVFAHIASSRIGEFNHRYAQPSLTHTIGFSNLPPYDTTQLLARQRKIGGVPKLILTNSSWEYWRGDGALVHVDPQSGVDLPDDPDTRVYLLSGTDHLGNVSMFKDLMPVANPANHLDASLVLRALLVALEQWVCEEAEPPASQIPRAADGSATDRAVVLRSVEASHRPDLAVINVTRAVDLGPRADAGIGRWPIVLGEPRVALVSGVDEDGNEIAGVRMPAIGAPVAVFTGWNPRRPVPGLPDVLYEFVGSQLPLPDGRPSLHERYGGRPGYIAAARAVAEGLVAQRLLLSLDVDRAVEQAVALYDEMHVTTSDGAER
jgi:Alpha/beta hydrolase domain